MTTTESIGGPYKLKARCKNGHRVWASKHDDSPGYVTGCIREDCDNKHVVHLPNTEEK